MALNNPLATVIKALSQQKRVEPKDEEKEKSLKKTREILVRLKDMQKWQKKADKQLLGLNLVIQKLVSADRPTDIKQTLDKINARLAPRTFNLGEQGQFQYDPLAPGGKQVTKLSRTGKASIGATKKDIEVVLKKAAYIFNQEIEKQNTVVKKEKKPSKNKKTSVKAKMMKSIADQPGKKDFSETYKNLAYEMTEDDPVYLVKKAMDKNFAKVFKQLKELRALIITNSSGLNPLDLLGRRGRPGTKPGKGGTGGSTKLGSMGRGVAGAAGGLLVGAGLGAYNSLRQLDPNRDKSDIGIDAAVNTAGAAYFGKNAVKSVQDARKKTQAASRLARMRSVNPDALKGTSRQNAIWKRFLKFVAKKAPKLAARVGTKLAMSAGLAAVPGIGWIAAGFNILGLGLMMGEVYDLWKEYNALNEEEKLQYENDNEVSQTSNVSSGNAAEKYNSQSRGSIGGRGAPQTRTGNTPTTQTGATNATGTVSAGMGSTSPTSNSSNRVEIKDKDGKTIEVREGGNINWRNNNPGNIRYSKWSIAHGATGENGGYAVFPSAEIGRKAADDLLRSGGYSKLNIADAINRWAPSADSNDPVAYAAHITKMTGVDSSKKYIDLSSAEKGKVLDAINRVEGGKSGKVLTAEQAAKTPAPTSSTPSASSATPTSSTPAVTPTPSASSATPTSSTPSTPAVTPTPSATSDAALMPADINVTDKSLPRDESTYAMQQLGMLSDSAPAVTPTPSATSNAVVVPAVTPTPVMPADINVTDKSLPRDESTYAMQQLGMLSDSIKPIQKIAGDVLTQNSIELESNRAAAAIPPVIIQQNTNNGGGGGCRFVPTPPAPLPQVDIKNADASIRDAFSRDRWA